MVSSLHFYIWLKCLLKSVVLLLRSYSVLLHALIRTWVGITIGLIGSCEKRERVGLILDWLNFFKYILVTLSIQFDLKIPDKDLNGPSNLSWHCYQFFYFDYIKKKPIFLNIWIMSNKILIQWFWVGVTASSPFWASVYLTTSPLKTNKTARLLLAHIFNHLS